MGQLEKYGLYVMCLVIFLILGVTLWGEPANATRTASRQQAAVGEGSPGPMEATFRGRTGRETLDALLRPESRPAPEPQRQPPQPDPQPTQAPQPTTSASPAPTPSPEPAPVVSRAATTIYKIKEGDSLGRIAQRQLGSVKFVSRIRELNPGIDENKLQIGKPLTLPPRMEESPAKESPNKAVASGAYRTYRVRKGDSMEKIAQSQLGSRSRWFDVRKMNPNVDPIRMQIGATIKLPLQ